MKEVNVKESKERESRSDKLKELIEADQKFIMSLSLFTGLMVQNDEAIDHFSEIDGFNQLYTIIGSKMAGLPEQT